MIPTPRRDRNSVHETSSAKLPVKSPKYQSRLSYEMHAHEMRYVQRRIGTADQTLEMRMPCSPLGG